MDSVKQFVQKALDKYYYLRKHVVTFITYYSLRIYGIEVTWNQVRDERYDSFKHTNLIIDRRQDLPFLLAEAKDGLKTSDSRLAAITDKSKVLITLSSLLLTLLSVLLPKILQDPISIKMVYCLSALAFFNSVILLLVIFGVRTRMDVGIEQYEIDSGSNGLQACIVNQYFQCRVDQENRTDYIVDVYKVARFFFLSAFTGLVIIFSVKLFITSPNEMPSAIARELRSDTNFIKYIRGEKGESGPRGELGPKGDVGSKGDKGEKGESVFKVIQVPLQGNIQTNIIIQSH